HLSLGDTHIPKNQKVALQLSLRVLARQHCAPLDGEILPSQLDARWPTQGGFIQEISYVVSLVHRSCVFRRARHAPSLDAGFGAKLQMAQRKSRDLEPDSPSLL